MRTTVYAGHEYICIIILNIRFTGDIRALSWNTDKMTNVFFVYECTNCKFNSSSIFV